MSGLSQLWDWTMDTSKEPPLVDFWDSLPQALGFTGYKFIKEVWLEYIAASTVTFQIVSDTGTYTKVLPAHATRAMERFYPGTVFGSGLNKSRLYEFSFSSASGVKMYSDSSGLRWLAMDGSRASLYQSVKLSEFMKLAA